MVPEILKLIEAAAAQALTAWGDADIALEDLVNELCVWYLSRPSVQERIAGADTDFHKRQTFYRGAMQTLAGAALANDAFNGKQLYSVDSIKAALLGQSTNKYLLAVLPGSLEDLERQNAKYREALRSRYEDGLVPKDNAGFKRLQHALTALVGHVNVEYVTDKQEPRVARGVHPESRRSSGRYSDPTADLALGLIKAGDDPIELADGSTTTVREEIMAEGFDTTLTEGRIHRPMSRTDDGVFDSVFIGQDRADMYRAQVVPELYPDEKPMLIDNWSEQDREEYCGGEFTPGFRRLSLVK